MPKTITANGYSFSYIEAGAGEPLVFVHGSLLDYRYWLKELEYFSDSFRSIAVSRRHHWPDKPSSDLSYTAVEQTDDVIALIDAMDLGPVHLVGHSYGGYIGARLACLRPDLLLSLTLIEPGGPIEGQLQGRSRIEDHKLGAQFVSDGDTAKGVAHFLDTVCFEPKWEDGSEHYKVMTLSNAMTITKQVQEIRPTLNTVDLSNIVCPVLLMIGAKSTSPFPETIDRLKELIPQATVASVSNASHMVNIDNHEEFLHVLDGFLKN